MKIVLPVIAALSLACAAAASPAYAGSLTLLGAGGGAGVAPLRTPFLSSFLLPASGSTSPQFSPIVGPGTPSAAFSSSQGRNIPIPFNGTVSGLYANLATSQPTVSVVDSINGVTKTLGCNFSASVTCTDGAHSDTVNAGDLLQFNWSLSSGSWSATSGPNQLSFIIQASSGQQGMLAATINNSAGVPGSNPATFLGFGAAGAVSTTELNVSSVMPAAGTIAAIYVTNNGVTENAQPHSYAVWKNGVATSMTCNMVASSVVGCCANLTGTGTVGASGSTANCTTTSSFSVAPGDTISVDAICSTAPTTPCAGVSPGISLLWLPTNPGQSVLTAEMMPNVGSPFLTLMGQGFSATQANTVQIAPSMGSSSLQFSNLIYCVKTNPGGSATRTATAQAGSSPSVAPTTVAGGSVAQLSVANGACPGANAATLLGGFQDNTHTWSVASGASLATSEVDVGGPAGGIQAWKLSYVATVTP